MGTIKMTIDKGQKPTEEQIAEIRKAAQQDINYDNAPELSAEQLAEIAAIAREKRKNTKKEVVSLRIRPETLEKAKATGKGYTGFLSRLLDYAINDPELVRRAL